MTCKVASLRGGVTPIMPMILMGIARSRLPDCWPGATITFFDGLNRSQTHGRGDIDSAARIDDDAVIAPRLLRRDQAVEHVVAHALRIAPARIAKTTAAGQMQLDGIARRHGLPAFWPDRATRAQRHGAGGAGLAAGAADLDHLAEPAAALAGAT